MHAALGGIEPQRSPYLRKSRRCGPSASVRDAVGGSQTRDQTMAAEHPRARVLGEGAAIPQAWAGGGPREGFLASMRWGNGRLVRRELQMLEAPLPDHLSLRDGRDNA